MRKCNSHGEKEGTGGGASRHQRHMKVTGLSSPASQRPGTELPIPARPRFLTHRPPANKTTEVLSHQVWGQFVTLLLILETEARRLRRRVLQKFG